VATSAAAFGPQSITLHGQLDEHLFRVAPQDTLVLFQGETGTGKTRLAKILHDLSPRRRQPFIVLSCGALSGSLIESELFGHAKGAFTGADRDRTGKLAEAGGGTILLDDIEALTIDMQVKLLHVIEARVFEPVGSNKSQPMPARVLSASNKPLENEVSQGKFRADLYYRLNVVTFSLPPLRECHGELPALAARFVDEFARSTGRTVKGFDPEELAQLQKYSWPGNVRELRNVVERAVVLCPGEWIRSNDLPPAIRGVAPMPMPIALAIAKELPTANPQSVGPRTLAESKEDAERTRIMESLRRNHNNRRRTAAELGISRMTLYKKLHRYSLFDERTAIVR
jgi:DNA-binding NtrC family response regulator